MKKSVKWLIALLSVGLLSVILLMTLKPFENKEEDKSAFYEADSKTTKTIQKDDKEAKKSDNPAEKATSKTSNDDLAESKDSTSEQVVEQVTPTNTAETITAVEMESLVNGDYSSLVGTWENAKGESITISSEGKVISSRNTSITYSLAQGRLQDGKFHTAIYNPDSEYGSAVFIVHPAGLPTPELGTTFDQDIIAIGHGIDSYYAENAFFKK